MRATNQAKIVSPHHLGLLYPRRSAASMASPISRVVACMDASRCHRTPAGKQQQDVGLLVNHREIKIQRLSRMPRLSIRALALLTLVLATTCTPEAPRFAFKHTERRGRFPNGLRFVLMPDMTTQMVEVDVRYDVGSRED